METCSSNRLPLILSLSRPLQLHLSALPRLESPKEDGNCNPQHDDNIAGRLSLPLVDIYPESPQINAPLVEADKRNTEDPFDASSILRATLLCSDPPLPGSRVGCIII